jgi:acetyl esterase
MSLDPQAQALLQALSQMPPLDYTSLTAPAFRQMAAAMRAMFAPGDAVARTENRVIPGPGGELAIRLYYPEGAGPFPLTVFFHGGGFVICDLDSHDAMCRCLCRRAGTLVASVDYRRAPEARFPAAADDAAAALAWVSAQAAALGGDPGRIAVAGDSAGGNLAAVLAQQARRHGPVLRHQLLIYPVMDCRCDSPTYRSFGDGYYLTGAMMRWFVQQYVDERQRDDVRASPLRQTDLAGVAPATILTAEFDPLRDEGEVYAGALRRAGVPVTSQRWAGQMHGFASMLGVLDAADAALSAGAEALRGAFRTQ